MPYGQCDGLPCETVHGWDGLVTVALLAIAVYCVWSAYRMVRDWWDDRR